ncbi:hypothetical protein BN1013_01179 [Candidatus Rubidus massiliensis]|nr:hypothetical protein BN1013_01179 [Candidatus Rubidus massiliensis]
MAKKKSHTQDEKFVLSLFEEVKFLEEKDVPFDRYIIGRKAGISEKAVDAICKLLVQANFIKKASQNEIYLTPHGEKLANRLSEEF